MKRSLLQAPGGLEYTPLALFAAGGWLLLGTASYNTVAYTLIPNGLTWQFHHFHASETTIALILGSIPAAMNIVMNPILSTWSDRLRTRIGRRKPFLLFAAPFIALFTVLLGCVPELSEYFAGRWDWPPETTGVVLLSILSLAFQFFSLIVGIVFCYLPPDVIPTGMIGRFMALIQVATLGGGILFNRFLIGYLEYNGKWVYLLMGSLFLGSFLLMCLCVREGKYETLPPAERAVPRHAGVTRLFCEYLRECFGCRLYVMMFAGTAITQASTVCRNLFNLLFATQDLKLTIEEYGSVMAAGGGLSIGILIGAGYLMDKLNPLLVYIASGLLVIAVNILGYYWVHDLNSFYVVGLLITLIYAMQGLCVIPMFTQVFPLEKFGQFCSANAIVNSIGLLIFNYLGGVCIRYYGYRFMFVWDFALTLIASIALIYVYVVLKRKGAEK